MLKQTGRHGFNSGRPEQTGHIVIRITAARHSGPMFSYMKYSIEFLWESWKDVALLTCLGTIRGSFQDFCGILRDSREWANFFADPYGILDDCGQLRIIPEHSKQFSTSLNDSWGILEGFLRDSLNHFPPCNLKGMSGNIGAEPEGMDDTQRHQQRLRETSRVLAPFFVVLLLDSIKSWQEPQPVDWLIENKNKAINKDAGPEWNLIGLSELNAGSRLC